MDASAVKQLMQRPRRRFVLAFLLCATILFAPYSSIYTTRSPIAIVTPVPLLNGQSSNNNNNNTSKLVGKVPDDTLQTTEDIPSWCSGITLSDVFSDDMLLQRDAKAAVYGTVQSANVSNRLGGIRHVWVDLIHNNAVVSQSNTSFVRGESKLGQEWKVLLQPHSAGTGYSLRVYCAGATSSQLNSNSQHRPSVEIHRVAFGDLFMCGGQSNMRLRLGGTFEGEATLHRLQSNPVQLRIMKRSTRRTPDPVFVGSHAATPWINLANLAQANKGTKEQRQARNYVTYFSSVCLHFGLSLLEKLGTDAPPIGLMQSCVGGTMIEEWLSINELASCKSQSGRIGGQLFNGMIAPMVNMTVRGWTYYQGENNVIGIVGNSVNDTGYGCMMPTLISGWRRWWAVEPDTTPTLGVFGLVTLAAGTDEGYPAKMSAFRWSQTANYGVAPNPKMPNVFVAQAFDQGDPWPFMKACTKEGCCGDGQHNLRNKKMSQTKCVTPRDIWKNTDWFKSPNVDVLMGPIHPRNKQVIGERLAIGMNSLSYGSKAEPFTGPTLKRCGLQVDKLPRNMLKIEFDSELLMGDVIEFTQDERLTEGSNSVALNSIGLCFGPKEICGCMQWKPHDNDVAGDVEWECAMHAMHATGLENRNYKPTAEIIGPSIESLTSYTNGVLNKHWLVGVVSQTDVGRAIISVDLDASINAHSGGDLLLDVAELRAVRYAWGLGNSDDTCCPSPKVMKGLAPCVPNNCPLRTRSNKLPGIPFFAVIDQIAGTCKCPLPQICS